MPDLTPEDRDQLRALASGATPGPWIPHPSYVWTSELGGIIQNWSEDANAAADMEFIAAARQAVPALLDMLDQAESERDQAQAALDRVRALHRHASITTRGATTPEDRCMGCQQAWPCPTIRALDGEQ